MTLGAVAEALTQVFVTGGAGEEALSEGAQVEAGSAGDNGESSAAGDFAQGCASLSAVVAGGERLIGVGDIDEVVRDVGAFFGCGFGGAEIHTAIDGDGIATDDFAVEALGEGEGEGGFAAAGGAKEENGQSMVLISQSSPL